MFCECQTTHGCISLKMIACVCPCVPAFVCVQQSVCTQSLNCASACTFTIISLCILSSPQQRGWQIRQWLRPIMVQEVSWGASAGQMCDWEGAVSCFCQHLTNHNHCTQEKHLLLSCASYFSLIGQLRVLKSAVPHSSRLLSLIGATLKWDMHTLERPPVSLMLSLCVKSTFRGPAANTKPFLHPLNANASRGFIDCGGGIVSGLF